MANEPIKFTYDEKARHLDQQDSRLRGYFPYFLWNGSIPSYKHIKIWGLRLYIINERVTRNKLDDRSHQGYFMLYAATTGVILYWKPDKTLVIHRAHNFWFDESNYRLYIEYKHTPISLKIQKYPESCIHNSDLFNLIPCVIDITYTIFSDTTVITYEIELPPSGKKVGFNLLDNKYFTIPYITDTIPNSPDVYQLSTHFV